MARALALLICCGLAACATPRPDPGDHLPLRAEVAEVPFHPQQDNYCGPAALAMALGWSGLEVAPAETAGLVFTPERGGAFQHDILAGARRYGRLALEIESVDDLLAEVAAGHPVVVLQNLGLGWYPVWHYAVVIGYDLPERRIVLHSGSERRRDVALSTFERTWARAGSWGLVVLPPGVLPAAGDEAALLRAAAGLERAGREAEAAAAYEVILGRWPISLGALIGLGNARYATGDMAGAESVLRRAAILHPEAAPAWNNLAHVLAVRGAKDSALTAARRAVALGGPHRATSQATLHEIVASQES